MKNPFGGEGSKDLITPSSGGGQPHEGSLPFNREGDVAHIVMGLLRHVVGDVVGVYRCILGFIKYFSAS